MAPGDEDEIEKLRTILDERGVNAVDDAQIQQLRSKLANGPDEWDIAIVLADALVRALAAGKDSEWLDSVRADPQVQALVGECLDDLVQARSGLDQGDGNRVEAATVDRLIAFHHRAPDNKFLEAMLNGLSDLEEDSPEAGPPWWDALKFYLWGLDSPDLDEDDEPDYESTREFILEQADSEAWRQGRSQVPRSGHPGRTVVTADQWLALVGASRAGTAVHLFDLDSGTRTARLEIPEAVHDLALSPDGERLVTAGREQPVVRLWRCRDGVELARVDQGESGAFGVAWAGTDDEVLVAGGRIDIYSSELVHRRFIEVPIADYDQCCRTLYGADDGSASSQLIFWTLAVSPRGDLIVAGEAGGNVCVIDYASGRLERVWGPQTALPQPMACAGDGSFVVSGINDVVRWDPRTSRGRLLEGDAFESGFNKVVALSDDDRMLLTVRGGVASLTNIDDGETLHRFTVEGGVTSAGFVRGGRHVLVCGADGVSRFHDCDDGDTTAVLMLFDEGGWLITDPENALFDGVTGNGALPEAEGEYTPGLLAARLG